jgi:Arc/MetJ-type ribon-helix-helix transcriptional regulator
MTVELKPEQERMIQEQLASGRFRSVDEVLSTALSRLPRTRRSNSAAVPRMIQFSKENSVKLPPGETLKDIVHEGHRY